MRKKNFIVSPNNRFKLRVSVSLFATDGACASVVVCCYIYIYIYLCVCVCVRAEMA